MEVRKNWLSETKLGWIQFLGNIAFIIYIGAIQMNDLKNMVAKHEQMFTKIEGQLSQMDNEKLDKEVFTQFGVSMQDIKSDIRDLKNILIEQMSKQRKN